MVFEHGYRRFYVALSSHFSIEVVARATQEADVDSSCVYWVDPFLQVKAWRLKLRLTWDVPPPWASFTE